MKYWLLILAITLVGCGKDQPAPQQSVALAASLPLCKEVANCAKGCKIPPYSGTQPQQIWYEQQADCLFTRVDPDKPWLWPSSG